MNCNESVIIMSAIRYMCGRSSYGVGCVIDFVKSRRDELTQSNKEVIERDITGYIKDFPDTPYKDEWLELINFIKS